MRKYARFFLTLISLGGEGGEGNYKLLGPIDLLPSKLSRDTEHVEIMIIKMLISVFISKIIFY